MEVSLFQTLEDRENPEEVEERGPFICRAKSAWLGFGYYFWDTYIELAHWWGNHSYGAEYIVCKADGRIDEFCWDLHGNGNHRLEFETASELIVERGITEKDDLTVAEVINFARKRSFKYTSIRALGLPGIGNNYGFQQVRIDFSNKGRTFLDLRPAVQICLLDKQALYLSNYRIVHPEYYVDNYT